MNLNTGAFLRPADAGLAGEASDYVVMAGGSPAVHNTVDKGDLLVDTTVEGIPVKSSFKMVVERVRERTTEEYAAIAGVSPNDLDLGGT